MSIPAGRILAMDSEILELRAENARLRDALERAAQAKMPGEARRIALLALKPERVD